MNTHTGRRIAHSVLGGLIGLVIGAIAAVNLVIFAGIDRGYESSLPEVFEENALVGVVTALILAAGPVVGIIVANRAHRGRDLH